MLKVNCEARVGVQGSSWEKAFGVKYDLCVEMDERW
jgi:hypothetical protein